MTKAKPPTHIQSLQRAIDVLELLEWYYGGLALSQISSYLGLNASTLHHILETLRDRGYVDQDSASRRYYLGPKVLHLASGFLRELNLHTLALPHMIELSNSCREKVLLRILGHDGLITLAKVDPNQTIALHTPIERIRAPHANSSGKVLLAALTYADRQQFLARIGLTRLTDSTITDPLVLEEQLARVSHQGYAIGRGEMDEGICGVAAPIRDRNHAVVAAVSVAVPTYRFTPELEEWLVKSVPQTAHRISQELARAAFFLPPVAVPQHVLIKTESMSE